MLLQVENLSGEKNSSAETDGADSVQCRSERRKARRRQRRGDMEQRDQQRDERKAKTRRERIPVGGHEQERAGAQQRGAQADGDPHRPAKAQRRFPAALEVANARGRGGVEDAVFDPAIEIAFPTRRQASLSFGELRRLYFPVWRAPASNFSRGKMIGTATTKMSRAPRRCAARARRCGSISAISA